MHTFANQWSVTFQNQMNPVHHKHSPYSSCFLKTLSWSSWFIILQAFRRYWPFPSRSRTASSISVAPVAGRRNWCNKGSGSRRFREGRQRRRRKWRFTSEFWVSKPQKILKKGGGQWKWQHFRLNTGIGKSTSNKMNGEMVLLGIYWFNRLWVSSRSAVGIS